MQNGRHLTLLLSLHSPFKASVAFTFLQFTLKFSGKGFFLIIQDGVQLAFLNRQFLAILVNGKQRPFVLLRRDHHLHDIGLASLGAPHAQGAEAEELWGAALAGYSMSDNIRSVELGEGADPGAVTAQLTQHGETKVACFAVDEGRLPPP